MEHVYIEEIKIENFKPHKSFFLKTNQDNVIIFGHNGSGKTSILEAISLISPGRGMNGVNMMKINRLENEIQAEKSLVDVTLNNGANIKIEHKISGESCTKSIHVNQKTVSKQSDLINWCDIIWFTANSQYDFLLSSSNRRKFLDRMVFSLFKNHATLINNNEKLIRERLRSLTSNDVDLRWVDAVEKQLSQNSLEIAKNRVNFVLKKNEISNKSSIMPFETLLDGPIEKETIKQNPNIEEYILNNLKGMRGRDRDSGRTNFGIHKTDVKIMDLNARVDFQHSSSGKQKMLLLAATESFAELIISEKKRTPIIIMDEIVSFLDDNNFKILMDALCAFHPQIWMASPKKMEMFDRYSMQFVEI